MFRGTRVELFSVAVLPLAVGLAMYGTPAIANAEAGAAPATDGPVSYAQQVAPILQEACGECHGATEPELGLDLTTYAAVMKGSDYGSVIEAGDADASLLVEMIVAGEMPVDADPLGEEEIELIRSWIAAGAEDN